MKNFKKLFVTLTIAAVGFFGMSSSVSATPNKVLPSFSVPNKVVSSFAVPEKKVFDPVTFTYNGSGITTQANWTDAPLSCSGAAIVVCGIEIDESLIDTNGKPIQDLLNEVSAHQNDTKVNGVVTFTYGTTTVVIHFKAS